MQALAAYAVSAPGFLGVNTTDSPTDLEGGYALSAINCVLDQYGRIGARKGWEPLHTVSASLGTSPVESIGEYIDADGSATIIVAGNNKLFKLSGSTLVELTYGGGGVAPTISGNRWSMCSIDGYFVMFQLGHDPLAYVPSVSTTQYRRLSEVAGYSGTVQLADVAISAFGRCWNAVTTSNKVTIQFSDVKSPHKYSGGSSGTLDLTTVWPSGGDSIVALGAHNNRLFIFGKQHVLIYKDASTPATMSLEDTLHGVGAVGKDSVCNTDTDIIFLSRAGVLSVMRTIQEKSAPIRDMSKNVRTDLLQAMSLEDVTKVVSTWNPKEGFVLFQFPVAQITYCFDTKQSLQNGAARVTTWDSINPVSMYTKLDGTLLFGQAGYVGQYSGYLDNTASYRMQYFSPYVDFGNPIAISMLKRITAVVIGGFSQVVTTKWCYDYTGGYYSQTATIPSNKAGEYGISEYGVAEYSSGVVINTMVSQASGSGKVAQIGIETNISGSALSLQKLEVYAKNGRLA